MRRRWANQPMPIASMPRRPIRQSLESRRRRSASAGCTPRLSRPWRLSASARSRCARWLTGCSRGATDSLAARSTQAFPGLRCPPALDARAQACGIEAGGLEAAVSRTVLNEAVGNTELQQRHLQAQGCKELADRGAGAAECRVFLDGHDGAVARRQGNHKTLVEGFHEAHVDERGVEALGDFLRSIDQGAECQERESAAPFKAHVRAADR